MEHNPPIELNWVGFCGQKDQRDHGVRSLSTRCPDYPQGKSLLLREEQEGYREGHRVKSPQGDRKQGMQLPIQAYPGKKRISFSIKQGQECNVIHQSLSKVLRGARIQHLFISQICIYIFISQHVSHISICAYDLHYELYAMTQTLPPWELKSICMHQTHKINSLNIHQAWWSLSLCWAPWLIMGYTSSFTPAWSWHRRRADCSRRKQDPRSCENWG